MVESFQICLKFSWLKFNFSLDSKIIKPFHAVRLHKYFSQFFLNHFSSVEREEEEESFNPESSGYRDEIKNV